MGTYNKSDKHNTGTVRLLFGGMVWHLHPLHLRFLLLPGAFSLLCFSDGKCFDTRDWNTPLKEKRRRETETETSILTAKWSGKHMIVLAVKTILIIAAKCWQADKRVVCVWSNTQTVRHLCYERLSVKQVQINQHTYHPFLVFLGWELNKN